MEPHKNKVAVILNSGSEIGIKVIENLVQEGMIVFGLYKNNDKYDLLTNEQSTFNKASVKKLTISALNASNVDKMNTVLRNHENYGNLSVFINIISNDFDCKLVAGNLETFKSIINSNISDAVDAVRLFASFMIESHNQGHIINISDCKNLDNDIFTMTTAAISSVNEILRHEFRYLKADIKTTHIEIKYSESKQKPHNKIEEAKHVADIVKYVLNTPDNMQVHELWLDFVDK